MTLILLLNYFSDLFYFDLDIFDDNGRFFLEYDSPCERFKLLFDSFYLPNFILLVTIELYKFK
jgi:hypothetical protein